MSAAYRRACRSEEDTKRADLAEGWRPPKRPDSCPARPDGAGLWPAS